jgi:branched-chain amino acid transport system substrate-binding protein
LLLGACSSSSSKSSNGSSGDTTASTLSPDTVLGTPKKATGTPVTVGLISASQSDSPVAAQFKEAEQGYAIAVKYANAYLGGLAGHPIQLFTCQGGETPAGSQDCANQMVNKNVVAVVMPFTSTGDSIVPVLTKAGIPYVALSGASADELTSKGAFALTPGFPGALGGYAEWAKNHGVKKLVMLATNGPGVIAGINAFGAPVFKKEGVGFSATPVPAGTADMTPQLQAAVSSGADAIGVVGDLTFCSSFFQAYQTLALTQSKYIISTCIDPTTVKAYGNIINGSVMSGLASGNLASKDAQVYAAITQKYGSGINPDPSISTGQSGGITALLSFRNVMDGYTGAVTPAAVLHRLETAKNTPLFLGDGRTYTCDGKGIPVLTTVCSADVPVGTVDSQGRLGNIKVINVTPLFAS